MPTTTRHDPVLLDRVVALLAPALERPDSAYTLDATLGLGGHSEAVLERLDVARVVGIDRDPEVEEALKSHPEVYDALVVGLPDERWGEQVATVIQPREGAEPSLESISAHCRQTIAGYKVPRAVTYVQSIKRSPAGKADYRWAKEMAGTD